MTDTRKEFYAELLRLGHHPVYGPIDISQVSKPIETEAPGSLQGSATLGVGVTVCGSATDGVSIAMKGEHAFVLPFESVERWYLANKAWRVEALKRKALMKP
jgi:hypothetical protein